MSNFQFFDGGDMTEKVYRYLTDKMDKRSTDFAVRRIRAGTLCELEKLAKRFYNSLTEIRKEIDYREKHKQLTPEEASALREHAELVWRSFSNAFVSRAIEISTTKLHIVW
jgi:branched-subunit amino acid aminotransferase/4-amino-4-deoxychorismate lyase